MTDNSNNTTTISINYLRLLTVGFEQSLAAGNFTPLEWTKALEEEHRSTVDRIYDYQASHSFHLQHQNFSSKTGRQDHYGQIDRYGHQRPYQLVKERLDVRSCHTHCFFAIHGEISDKHIPKSTIEETVRSCRHTATKFDDVVKEVLEILRQPSGQFPLMEDLAAQSLLDNLQMLIEHHHLEKQFRGTTLSALLSIPRRSNIYPSNFSFDDIIELDGQMPVASGGFADIYKAWWPHDNRAVCLKVYRKIGASSGIKASLYRIANREAFIWRHLSHENVVPFYGVCQFGDSRIALVSPWIKHGHIHHFLALNPDSDRTLLISDVARGLSYLHRNNIVHGDLKGTNILVTDTHRACLTDFGLSSITDIQGFTTVGGGAIRWQAPELLGEVEVQKTRASDIYAFAMSCYEVFTGKKPFPEVVRDLTVITKVLAGERISRPSQSFGLDDDIWALIEDCWHHDPHCRLTATQIVHWLNVRSNNRKRRPISEDVLLREFMSNGRVVREAGLSSAETLMALENIVQEVLLLKMFAGTTPEKENTHPGHRRPSTRQIEMGQRQPLSPYNTNSAAASVPATGLERGNTPGSEDSNGSNDKRLANIISNLEDVFKNIELYKLFLNRKRSKSQSQSLLDLFQQLLGDSTLEPQFRHNLVVATQRLAKTANLYPSCFSLENENVGFVDEQPVTAGGFADIHKGFVNGKQVCLKVIRLYQASQVDYTIKHFYQEAILWGLLSHPNLLPFHGLYYFRNRLCLVSPWVENGDINKYLERNPRANRILLALDVAMGVSYLHANDIIHGDLKGPNILVDDSGRGRLADFGLSALTDPQILKWTSQSSAASKGGSVRWQAPELFGAESDEIVPNSKASDIYAWGCVCYEIFAGDIPFFEFSRDSTVMLKVGLGKRPSCPHKMSPSWVDWGLTDDIWSLKQECWKEDPIQRPSADEIVARLSSTSVDDTRSIMSQRESSVTQFDIVGQQYPSITLLEAMLWGVPISGGSLYQ